MARYGREIYLPRDKANLLLDPFTVGLNPIVSAFLSGYFHSMNNINHFFKSNKAGFVLGTVLLVGPTGHMGDTDGQSAKATGLNTWH